MDDERSYEQLLEQRKESVERGCSYDAMNAIMEVAEMLAVLCDKVSETNERLDEIGYFVNQIYRRHK